MELIDSITRVVPTLLESTLVTLQLFALTLLFSIPLGGIITIIARTKVKIIRWIADIYIYVFRGTPLLLQLLFLYFGLPKIQGIGQYLTIPNSFTCAIIGFTLNYAAYFAEIFRGGLLAVDKGQYEAAQVLGLSKKQTMMNIIMPQVTKVVLPSVCNEAITLVKDTSLVFGIGLVELLTQTKQIVNSSADTFAYVIAAVIYLIMTSIIAFVFRKMEKRYLFGEGE